MVAADYHEWPINGLFKQTRFGNRASFHLKFHLTNTPDHLELSALFASLGSTNEFQECSSRDISDTTDLKVL